MGGSLDASGPPTLIAANQSNLTGQESPIFMNSQQKKERNMAVVLVCLVILFIICQSLKIAPDVYEAVICTRDPTNCETSFTMEIIISVSHLLLSVNSAANFGIYMLRGDRFRQVLAKIVLRCQCTKASRRLYIARKSSRGTSRQISSERTEFHRLNSGYRPQISSIISQTEPDGDAIELTVRVNFFEHINESIERRDL